MEIWKLETLPKKELLLSYQLAQRDTLRTGFSLTIVSKLLESGKSLEVMRERMERVMAR